MISIKNEDFCGNYDLFVKLCEITAEPVRLVKDGKTDLVVMSADTYERRKRLLDLREKLLAGSKSDNGDHQPLSLSELGKILEEID